MALRGVLPSRGRPGRDHLARAAAATAPQRRGPGALGGAAPAAVEGPVATGAGAAPARSAGRVGHPGALSPRQADRRRVPRGRQQVAGAARAGAVGRYRPQGGGSAHDGLHRRTAHAQSTAPAGAGGARRRFDAGRWTPLSLLLGTRAAPAPWLGKPRPGVGLAGGVEVRRHPRSGGAPGRSDLGVVARRRTGDRALSRGGGPGPSPARGHGAGWRGAGLAARAGQAGVLPPAAAAHRPQAVDQEGAGRGAGALSRVRPAGAGRGGPARPAAAGAKGVFAGLVGGVARGNVSGGAACRARNR